jgi:hypothetical protein
VTKSRALSSRGKRSLHAGNEAWLAAECPCNPTVSVPALMLGFEDVASSPVGSCQSAEARDENLTVPECLRRLSNNDRDYWGGTRSGPEELGLRRFKGEWHQ